MRDAHQAADEEVASGQQVWQGVEPLLLNNLGRWRGGNQLAAAAQPCLHLLGDAHLAPVDQIQMASGLIGRADGLARLLDDLFGRHRQALDLVVIQRAQQGDGL